MFARSCFRGSRLRRLGCAVSAGCFFPVKPGPKRVSMCGSATAVAKCLLRLPLDCSNAFRSLRRACSELDRSSSSTRHRAPSHSTASESSRLCGRVTALRCDSFRTDRTSSTSTKRSGPEPRPELLRSNRRRPPVIQDREHPCKPLLDFLARQPSLFEFGVGFPPEVVVERHGIFDGFARFAARLHPPEDDVLGAVESRRPRVILDEL